MWQLTYEKILYKQQWYTHTGFEDQDICTLIYCPVLVYYHALSVTWTIEPSIFPALIYTGAVKFRFANPAANIIMHPAQPLW